MTNVVDSSSNALGSTTANDDGNSDRGTLRQRSSGCGVLNCKHDRTTEQSVLKHLYQQGCAKIRLPNRCGSTLEAVTINTAGGLTGGDDLVWQFTAGSGSHLRISSAACEKIYRTHGPTASLVSRLTVAKYARLDWLPQETLLFDRAGLHRRLHVELDSSSRLLIVEPLLLGRQAMGESVHWSDFRDDWRIQRDGRLLHAEAMRLQGNVGAFARRQALLAGFTACATLLYCGPEDREALKLLAMRINRLESGGVSRARVAASVLPHRVVTRVLARDGLTLRRLLIPGIEILTGGNDLPRVWTM